MPQYNPPLRDMQFVLHELFDVVSEFKDIPEHAEVDADTINAVLEEGGKFAAGRVPAEHQRRRRRLHAGQGHPRGDPPKGFKEAYAQYVEGGWPALSCDPEYGGQGLPHTINQASTRCSTAPTRPGPCTPA
jgi:alkylation response protein AidB-like acyl-CoA dehydrogenase